MSADTSTQADARHAGNRVDLKSLALAIRRSTLRMTSAAGTSHIASMFSIADIVAVLYGEVMNVDAAKPTDPDRDRFILSKGHAGAAIYAALAEIGFLDKQLLETYCANGSILSGHVSHLGVPGIELSTGSLGHGLGIACGMAYSGRLARRASRYFNLLSDGECDEGSNWEAILFAGHHRLGRLTAIIDYNKIQSLASCEDTLGLEPFVDKWRSFRWSAEEVDGHDHKAMTKLLSRDSDPVGEPRCVIAHTTKGKGVSFMENTVLWHYRCAKGEEFDRAWAELNDKGAS
jgi:transketolase